jgi:hypothetical protein
MVVTKGKSSVVKPGDENEGYGGTGNRTRKLRPNSKVGDGPAGTAGAVKGGRVEAGEEEGGRGGRGRSWKVGEIKGKWGREERREARRVERRKDGGVEVSAVSSDVGKMGTCGIVPYMGAAWVRRFQTGGNVTYKLADTLETVRSRTRSRACGGGRVLSRVACWVVLLYHLTLAYCALSIVYFFNVAIVRREHDVG